MMYDRSVWCYDVEVFGAMRSVWCYDEVFGAMM